MDRSRTAPHTRLPRGLNFGEPILLTFNHPSVATGPYRSFLQDFAADGSLCIDAPAGLSPAPGTPVLISCRNRRSGDIRFATKVLGRKRLNGRIPVLLVNRPTRVAQRQRRASYRIATGLKTTLEWQTFEPKLTRHSQGGIIANLSGGGAKVLVRQVPDADLLRLSLDPDRLFLEAWARRQLDRGHAPGRPLPNLEQLCAKLRAEFVDMEVRPVHTQVESSDRRGPLHALCLAFTQPQEGCYRLVSHLERHDLQKGLISTGLPLPHAA